MTHNAPSEVRRRCLVSGLVQMVGFRAYAARRADELGLVGWVRNLADGRLETVAQGPLPAVLEYIDFLREGPPAALVEMVQVEEEAVGPGLSPFAIAG
jgi:acylphosphatase